MIRAFIMADLHTLHRMICGTVDASYSELYPPRAVSFFKEHHSEKKIAERSAVGEILVFVSEIDGSILATGSLIDSEIIGVFVRPDHQRKGHGRAIMARLEQIAMEKEIPKLSLSISLPSRQFYEHLGYTVLDECVLDVGGGECLKFWSGEKELHRRDRQKAIMATVEIIKTAGDVEVGRAVGCSSPDSRTAPHRRQGRRTHGHLRQPSKPGSTRPKLLRSNWPTPIG